MQFMEPVSIALRAQVCHFGNSSCNSWNLFLLLCELRSVISAILHAIHGTCFYCSASSGLSFRQFFIQFMELVSIALRAQVCHFGNSSCNSWNLFLLLCELRSVISAILHAIHGTCFYCSASSGLSFRQFFMQFMEPVSIALRAQVCHFGNSSCNSWNLFLLLCELRSSFSAILYVFNVTCFYCFAFLGLSIWELFSSLMNSFFFFL